MCLSRVRNFVAIAKASRFKQLEHSQNVTAKDEVGG
jgi:hypothetical protein